MNAQRSIQQYLDDQHALLEIGLAALERSVAAHDFSDGYRRLVGFRAHLDRYVRGEERILFPVYEQLPSVQHEPIARLRQEHGRLRRLVAALAAVIDRRNAPRALDALATLRSVLLLHGAKEDWLIYPRLVDAMPTWTQDMMIRALRDGVRLAS